MREFFDLANNPLFVKHVRSRLRRNAVLPGVLIVGFLCLCILWINSEAKRPNGPDSTVASQMFFWLQGILLVLLGGSQVASSIAQMKESGIIDFHRITPVPAPVQSIGIMLGAPIRELLLYAITLPFALFVAIDGPIGIGNFAKLVMVQLGSALMYYSLAMIAGFTGGKARGASGRFVAVLAGMNLLSNVLVPAGVYGPALITSIPVYFEVFGDDNPAVPPPPAPMPPAKGPNQGQPIAAPPAAPAKPAVTFYGMEIPVVLQSLLFQGCLLTFLFSGASRRIRSGRLPLYSKPIALMFLGTLAFLTLGSLWESPTEFLTLGAVYFLMFCAILLTSSVTPLVGDVIKGMQRARKLTGMRVPIWSDLAVNKYVIFFFACLIGISVSTALLLAPQPPLRLANLVWNKPFTPWPPLVVGIFSVLSYGFVVQYFALTFGRAARIYAGLFIFFAWIAPLIVGIFALMAQLQLGVYFMAMSPFLGVATAGGVHVEPMDEVPALIASIAPGAILTVVFFALLVNEERKLTSHVIDEHGSRKRKGRDHDE